MMEYHPDDIFMPDEPFSLSEALINDAHFSLDPESLKSPFTLGQSDDALFNSSLAELMGDYTPKDVAQSSYLYSDTHYNAQPGTDPGAPDDHRGMQPSTTEDGGDQDERGHISPSRLSSISESSFSSPSFDNDFAPQVKEIEWAHSPEDTKGWSQFDEEDIMRRHSLGSFSYGTTSSTDQEEPTKTERSKSCVTHEELLKPRRRRGRKPSNLSPEEKRRRRLERGRLAANKCRRKKRELENELETKAKDLAAQRNHMLKISNDLKDEVQSLLEEVMNHSHAACGGIPEATGLVGHAMRGSPPTTRALLDLERSVAHLYSKGDPNCMQVSLSPELADPTAHMTSATPNGGNAMANMMHAGYREGCVS